MIVSDLLDIGCGTQKLEGAIGMDIAPLPGIDIVHDMNSAPWPLADSSFARVRCRHVIEHIQNLSALSRELYRVCRNGARIDFITPHFSSYASWGDPTHVHHFALGSIVQLFEQQIGAGGFRVVSNDLHFTGSFVEFPGVMMYKLSRHHYEKHFAWMFPANEVHTTLEIVKPDGEADRNK